MHLSSDHLNREFKKNTGYTIMGYIQYYRILVAKDLLTRTDKSIMEISIETGFESPWFIMGDVLLWI
ncbi:MAG: helix-turn-helix domain-containing protein [Clostridium sp.]